MTPNQQRLQVTYPTYSAFLEDFKPEQLMVTYVNIDTIVKSVLVLTPRLTLEDISIVYSDGKLSAGVDYMKRWLDYMNEFSNLNKKLTETRAVAFKLYNTYKYFYLTDLNLIFDKIMNCEYGIFYGSVDAPRILGAFLQYSHERNATLDNAKICIDSELNAYIRPLEKEEYKTIQRELAKVHSDEKTILAEGTRIWNTESVPKLKKLKDEMELSLYKKYNESIR